MNQISIRAKHIVYILVVALLFLVWSFIYRFPLCRFAVYIDQSRTVATMYPGRKQWKTLGMDKLSDDNMQYIQRPHLMLFGRLYWSSPNSDGPVPTQDLICIGEVTESVEESVIFRAISLMRAQRYTMTSASHRFSTWILPLI